MPFAWSCASTAAGICLPMCSQSAARSEQATTVPLSSVRKMWLPVLLEMVLRFMLRAQLVSPSVSPMAEATRAISSALFSIVS